MAVRLFGMVKIDVVANRCVLFHYVYAGLRTRPRPKGLPAKPIKWNYLCLGFCGRSVDGDYVKHAAIQLAKAIKTDVYNLYFNWSKTNEKKNEEPKQ